MKVSVKTVLGSGGLSLILLSGITIANEPDSGQKRLTQAEIKGIPFVEAGTGTSGVSSIQTRILKGSPKQKGLYTIQLFVPANTRIEAHVHSDDRIATVISGDWSLGYGSNFDSKKLKHLPRGSFYTEPPNEPHFAQTGSSPAVVQITGMGPSQTTYVKD